MSCKRCRACGERLHRFISKQLIGYKRQHRRVRVTPQAKRGRTS